MRLASVIVISVLVSSCAVNPATGGRYLNLAGDTSALGENTAKSAIQADGLYTQDEQLSHYYQNLGAHLRSVVDAPDEPIDFILLDSPTYNAWATPGYINVYRGILPYFNSEAELVSVMAHESGHIMARHIARGQTKQVLAGLAVTTAGVLIANRTGSSAAGQAAIAIGGLGATLAISAYSRTYEREADALGLKYMEKMGYDPREAYHTFRGMEAYEHYAEKMYGAFHGGEAMPRSPFYNLLLSHPEPTERQANVVEAKGMPDGSVKLPAGVKPATPANDPQGRARYLEVLDGLPVGPKLAEQGAWGKDVYYSPAHRLAWLFAVGKTAGFVAQYTGERWQAIRPNTNQRLYIQTVRLGEDDAPKSAEKVLHELAGDNKADKMEKLSAAGRTGMIGFYNNASKLFGNKYAQGKLRIAVLPSGKGMIGKEFLAVFFLNWADADIRTSLDAMKPLRETQAKTLAPLRVDVVTVQAGDTLQGLASQMASGALQTEYFTALNGMDANTPLIPGAQAKLIIDPNKGRF